MRLRHPLILPLVCLLGGGSVTALGQEPTGISVSPAKVFDNRSLVIMLEQLEKQLQSISVIDSQKDKLLAALANFQGARITEVARALSIAGPASPSVTTTETAGADASGLQPSERTTERAAATPTAPSLQAAPSALSMSPAFGVQAQDLLSDQVSLSYQIVNVRLLLERALSDRLLLDKRSRVQVVLGFQIGIDPPKDAKDKAAIVELMVKSANGSPLSLVSVMPYEKTYNAYAIDRRSNAFGGAAIAKVISLGYSERRGSESLYLYKDADTLALGSPKLAEESAEVTFGWAFRPVLGRRAVSPGLRQMFAVIALPVEDKGVEPLTLHVSARTYWRKYDAHKSTTSGTSKAALTSIGSVNALTTEAISTNLSPRIRDVQWRAMDDKTAVVRIAGTNLFSGTQVMLGSKVYDSAATGLIFKSDQLLELRTTVSELALGDGTVSGRYGEPVPLSAAPDYGSGIFIHSVNYKDLPGRESLDVEVLLQSQDSKDLILPPEQPLLSVGSEVARSVYAQSLPCEPVPMAVPGSRHGELDLRRALTVVRAPDSKGQPVKVDCWQFTGTVPAAKFHGEPVVTIRYPFRGDRWQATFAIRLAFEVSSVTQLGTISPKNGPKMVRLAINGRDFQKDFSVFLDREYKAPELEIQPTLMRVAVDAGVLAGFKSLIVQTGSGYPVVVKLPDGKPAPLVPSIDANQQKTVKKDTSVAVKFNGKDLKGIKAAKFDGKALTMEVSDDGKAITIYLTRDVTAKTGAAVVLLETDDGLIPLTVTIDP